MRRKVIAIVVSLGVVIAFACLLVSTARADSAQRSALVGQWSAANPNDTSALVFMGDGSWALASSGRATFTGTYAWSGEDTIQLDFMRDGTAMVMTWRVYVAQDTLQVAETRDRTVKWVRVNTRPDATPTRPTERSPSNASGSSQLATVQFEGAVIGLTKADGSTWDNSAVTSVSAADRRKFQEAVLKMSAKAAATDPLAAAAGIVAVIGTAVLDAKAKPDPVGTVELIVDGQTVGGERGKVGLRRILDNYTPSWSLGPWTHIPLDAKHDVRLRLRLEDDDPDWLGGNDPIGTVVVNSDDLLRAAKLRKVLPVYVGDQSQNQLVLVNVSVTMEAGAR